MKRVNIFKVIILFLITVTLTILFNSKIGSLPPLAKFLNPFTGFWQNAEQNKRDSTLTFELTGIREPVQVFIDSLGIPHIFAENDYDAFFAQGYITAKDRLWQMDFQSRYAAGRLSEVIGEKAIELDRYQRRMGMAYAAEIMLEESKRNPESHSALQAYSDGINSYINSLQPKDYPIEFKLLDYRPEKWTSLNSALLLKLMSATLATGSDEMKMSTILETYGKATVDDLFPNYPFKEDPIIPVGTQWNFTLSEPQAVNSLPKAKDNLTSTVNQKSSLNHLFSNLLTEKKEEHIGSNNWAVDADKSATKYPLLANDPHLNLTLPSIWYQIQIHTPDMNVYGVSLPGAPSVIIGFNQNAAWGVTNVASDVLDWYKIEFKDNHYQEYLYDGVWEKTSLRVEEIKVRNKPSLLDSVYYTKHGPVSYTPNTKPKDFEPASNVPIGYALKWVAHLPSNELQTFYELNRAASYEDYRNALKHFIAPAQNFLFANNKNEISITSNGYFPLKEKEHGKFLLDGTISKTNWTDQIPFEQRPTIKNPTRGFLSSANQSPTDPSYPYYLDWVYSPYERGHRINTVLDSLSNIKTQDFVNLLNDNYSVLAENVLSLFLNSIDQTSMSNLEEKNFIILKNWDKKYEANSIAASLFEKWFDNVSQMIWHDKFGRSDKKMRYPTRDRTVQLLLHEESSSWFTRSREEILTISFKQTIEQFTKRYGKDTKEWQWKKVRESRVNHLANIDGFASHRLDIGGAKHTVNAMGEKHGPSWKMIVELGENPRAFGIIPGGQSGNPGSKFYDNQLPIWEKGDLKPLLFLKDTTQHKEMLQVLKISPN